MTKSRMNVSKNQLTVYPDPSRYSPGTVKFAAYVFSGKAHVFVDSDMSVRLSFHKKIGLKDLKKEEILFREELDGQKIRGEIQANNQNIREFIMRKAVSNSCAGQGGL